MPRKPDSNSGDAPAWLEEQVYGPKRQRTVDLVRQAVDALAAAEQRVSMASVAAKSKEMDPDGLGVSESSILVNREAHAYYDQHRTWKHPQTKRASGTDAPPGPPSVRVKPDRDVGRVRRRYLRMSKQELMDRLVAVEQAYAAQEERWLQANDELLATELQSEQAELDPRTTPSGSTGRSPQAGQVERLRRRIEGMQRALDAKEATIQGLRRELRAVYAKTLGPGLTDSDLQQALQAALARAENAERRLADFRAAVFAHGAMRVASISRKWQPNRRRGKGTPH